MWRATNGRYHLLLFVRWVAYVISFSHYIDVQQVQKAGLSQCWKKDCHVFFSLTLSLHLRHVIRLIYTMRAMLEKDESLI